jgi:hypothetical protein
MFGPLKQACTTIASERHGKAYGHAGKRSVDTRFEDTNPVEHANQDEEGWLLHLEQISLGAESETLQALQYEELCKGLRKSATEGRNREQKHRYLQRFNPAEPIAQRASQIAAEGG